MADFSKQYCDRYDKGMTPDFDIDKELVGILPGNLVNMICEGFGFWAVGFNKDGVKICEFGDYNEGTIAYLPLEYISDKTHTTSKTFKRFVIIGKHDESDSFWIVEQVTFATADEALKYIDSGALDSDGLVDYNVWDTVDGEQVK